MNITKFVLFAQETIIMMLAFFSQETIIMMLMMLTFFSLGSKI